MNRWPAVISFILGGKKALLKVGPLCKQKLEDTVVRLDFHFNPHTQVFPVSLSFGTESER